MLPMNSVIWASSFYITIKLLKEKVGQACGTRQHQVNCLTTKYILNIVS
jgi:hypothetical protein